MHWKMKVPSGKRCVQHKPMTAPEYTGVQHAYAKHLFMHMRNTSDDHSICRWSSVRSCASSVPSLPSAPPRSRNSTTDRHLRPVVAVSCVETVALIWACRLFASGKRRTRKRSDKTTTPGRTGAEKHMHPINPFLSLLQVPFSLIFCSVRASVNLRFIEF